MQPPGQFFGCHILIQPKSHSHTIYLWRTTRNKLSTTTKRLCTETSTLFHLQIFSVEYPFCTQSHIHIFFLYFTYRYFIPFFSLSECSMHAVPMWSHKLSCNSQCCPLLNTIQLQAGRSATVIISNQLVPSSG